MIKKNHRLHETTRGDVGKTGTRIQMTFEVAELSQTISTVGVKYCVRPLVVGVMRRSYRVSQEVRSDNNRDRDEVSK